MVAMHGLKRTLRGTVSDIYHRSIERLEFSGSFFCNVRIVPIIEFRNRESPAALYRHDAEREA
jgi:hypothetical protein